MNVFKTYIDNCELYYPLKDNYGDTSVVFLKTKYITNQKPFSPRIKDGYYPELTDCLVKNIKTGKMMSVFRNLKIDKGKYRLLQETFPDNTEALDWYEVEETWGYTPTTSTQTSVITAWTRPAYKVGIDSELSKPITSSIVNEDNTATLSCDNSDGRISAGDILTLTSSEYESETAAFRQVATNVSVKSADSSSFIVEPFLWKIYKLDGSPAGEAQSFSNESALKKEGVAIVATIIGDTIEMSLLRTDKNNQMHIVAVDNSNGKFKAGDLVIFRKLYYQYLLQWYYEQTSDAVRIEKATADSIVVPYFQWNVESENGSIISSDDAESGFYVPGKKLVSLIGETRSAWAADFAGIQIVDYVSELKPQNAWSPESGRAIVDYLSYYTKPTLDEYLQMISRGKMVLAQPQVYELFMGDIYRRTSVYVKCQ